MYMQPAFLAKVGQQHDVPQGLAELPKLIATIQQRMKELLGTIT